MSVWDEVDVGQKKSSGSVWDEVGQAGEVDDRFDPAGLAVGAGEVALSGLTNLAGSAYAGNEALVRGAYSALTGGDYSMEQAAQDVEQRRGELTYQPRTRGGKKVLSGIQTAADYAGEIASDLGIPTYDELQQKGGDLAASFYGDQQAGAITAGFLEALPEALAFKGIQRLQGPIRLKDDQGNPTAELREILADKGLNYESLTPEAQAQIPAVVEPAITARGARQRVGEETQAEDIRAGGTQAGLAPYTMGAERVMPDPEAKAALQSDWDSGFVQMVKNADIATLAKMDEMLTLHDRGRADFTQAENPAIVAGNSLFDRIDFLRDKANDLSGQLDDLVKQELPLIPMNPQPVVKAYTDLLDSMNIKYELDATGRPLVDFKASDIDLDKSTQKAINNIGILLGRDAPITAQRFHGLKKNFDKLIDWGKSSQTLTSKSGEAVYRRMRGVLNDQIREVVPEYARINDGLSDIIDGIDRVAETMDKKGGLMSDFSNRSVAIQGRKMFSNYAIAPQMQDAVNNLQRLADDLGGQFDDNLPALWKFGSNLEARLGAKGYGGNTFQEKLAASQAAQSLMGDFTGGVGAQIVDALVSRSKEKMGLSKTEQLELDRMLASTSLRNLLAREIEMRSNAQ